MPTLTPDECRVLGVLIEKAMTVPGQYPISLNGLAAGASQRNNRDPVAEYSEERALAAVDRLRSKSLAAEVHMTGSRVIKFRHTASEALTLGAPEKAVLAELLLRGPQTLGELRGRASRMHAFESMEAVQAVLDAFSGRPEPLVKRVAPAPGSRAERWAQLLCPDLHPLESPASQAPAGPTPGPTLTPTPSPSGPDSPALAAPAPDDLRTRLEQLEDDVAEIKALLAGLSKTS